MASVIAARRQARSWWQVGSNGQSDQPVRAVKLVFCWLRWYSIAFRRSFTCASLTAPDPTALVSRAIPDGTPLRRPVHLAAATEPAAGAIKQLAPPASATADYTGSAFELCSMGDRLSHLHKTQKQKEVETLV